MATMTTMTTMGIFLQRQPTQAATMVAATTVAHTQAAMMAVLIPTLTMEVHTQAATMVAATTEVHTQAAMMVVLIQTLTMGVHTQAATMVAIEPVLTMHQPV